MRADPPLPNGWLRGQDIVCIQKSNNINCIERHLITSIRTLHPPRFELFPFHILAVYPKMNTAAIRGDPHQPHHAP